MFIKARGDSEVRSQLESAVSKNYPAICIELNDLYDLGEQFFNWEFATAVCGVHLKINPFNQPDVESSKKHTKKFVDDYKLKGLLAEPEPLFNYQGLEFFAESSLENIEEFKHWLNQKIEEKSYVSIQAFIAPSERNEKLLRELADDISSRFGVPATFGFGPRYLHSTGQLHKGDGGRGVFIQLTADITDDIPVPDGPESDKSSISFGVLRNAQSLGDYRALADRERNIVRINMGSSVEESLAKFAALI